MTIALTPAIVRSLAPTGTLRAAINIGNPVLVQSGPGGTVSGITVDIANDLAKRLGVPLQTKVIDGAGKSFEAVKSAACDIGFLAVEPARATEINFTAPYVIIEGVYMVWADGPLARNEDVDRPGNRIAVTAAAAYDLFLTRSLKHATLVRSGEDEAFDQFLRERFEAAAGVKQAVVRFIADHPQARILPGRFMEIQQAMCLPKGRDAGAAYLRAYVEELKSAGFVAAAIARARQEATVAPAA